MLTQHQEIPEYKAGDFITVNSANTHRITSVVSNTLMVTSNNFGASVSGKTHARYFPVDVPINMDGTSSNVYVGTNSNTVTIVTNSGNNYNEFCNGTFTTVTNSTVQVLESSDFTLSTNNDIVGKLNDLIEIKTDDTTVTAKGTRE